MLKWYNGKNFNSDCWMLLMNSLVKHALICLAVSMSMSSVSAITVYKSIGAHGEVKYSQLPPKNAQNVEAIEFRSDGRVNTPGTQAAPPVDPATAQQNQVNQLSRQVQELQERENAQRCQTLRNNLANLNIGGRIYEMDASGNRVYLNDQEINSRRTRIQQAISQYCSGTGSST